MIIAILYTRKPSHRKVSSNSFKAYGRVGILSRLAGSRVHTLNHYSIRCPNK